MKYRFALLPIVLLISTSPFIKADKLEDLMHSIKAADIFELNAHLASPEMQGRLAGTEGYNQAARWVAAKFKEWGVEPLYHDYLQPFEVSYNETHNGELSLIPPPEGDEGKPDIRVMEMYKDFCPTLYSGFGETTAEVIFAGFGITSPELDWDDYGDVDVKGKVVAIITGTPQVPGRDFSEYHPRPYKLKNAKEHGAAGLIILARAVIAGYGTYQEFMPMVMAGNEVAEILFGHKGYGVESVRALLRDGNPLTFETGVRAKMKVTGVHHPSAETYNVVGLVEGSHPVLKDEYVVFGGHLDGVGPWPRLHPGASDNASGSVVVMKLAQTFAELKKKPKRSIVFALFGGEELGLLGSEHMAANLPESPAKPVFMINIDVAGSGTGFRIAGGETYPELYGLLEKVNQKYSINKNVSTGEIQQSFGNSDYASFIERGIPAYSTSTTGGGGFGIHTEEDSIYNITPQIMEDMTRLYFMAVYQFADR
jgi:hypothetical protein